MKNLLFPLVLAVVILVLDIIVSDAIVHTKLEVQRVGACGINGMGTELCDVLFTNGSMQRIKRGPEIGDSVWVDMIAYVHIVKNKKSSYIDALLRRANQGRKHHETYVGGHMGSLLNRTIGPY